MATLELSEDRVKDCSAQRCEMQSTRLIPTNPQYAELCLASIRRLPRESRSRLTVLSFEDWEDADAARRDKTEIATIFVSRLADVSADFAKRARKAGRARHLLFAEGLPIESLASRLPQLDVRNARRIHVARAEGTESISKILYRSVRGVAQSKGARTILDAWIEGETLVLLSPQFERLGVPTRKLERHLGKTETDIRGFEIDEDGSFLFWPHADVHLGWEQMEQIVDPASAVAAKNRTDEFNQRYGAAIRALREKVGLRQAAIEGLTERHLRRIEQGKQAATSSALKSLAGAHGMNVEDYLKNLAAQCSQGTD